MNLFFSGRAGKGVCRQAFQGSATAPLLRNAFGALTILLAFFMAAGLSSCSKSVKQPQVQTASGDVLDFDLTQMNPNMVYAQVFSLMMEPESYEGKIFKLKGTFIKALGPDGGPAYAVIVKDALGCCQQGIEFKYDFAGKEPDLDQPLTVTGPYTVTTTKSGIMHNFVMAQTVEM